MLTKRTNQGGSVATFIVIGLILISGLIGTIYFVNQRGEQVRKEKAIAAIDREAEAKKQDESKDSPKQETVENNNDTLPEGTSETPTSSEDLPVTGPEMSFGELLVIYSLTTFSTAYIISRRKLTRSL